MGPLFKNKRSRTIAKGDGLRSFRSGAIDGVGVRWENCMPNSVDIDSQHSRAIVKEIGERLRASLEEDRELPVNFRKQIERLRQSESEAQAKLARFD